MNNHCHSILTKASRREIFSLPICYDSLPAESTDLLDHMMSMLHVAYYPNEQPEVEQGFKYAPLLMLK